MGQRDNFCPQKGGKKKAGLNIIQHPYFSNLEGILTYKLQWYIKPGIIWVYNSLICLGFIMVSSTACSDNGGPNLCL